MHISREMPNIFVAHPQQLNSMMGFVLNRRGGRFMGLTQEETDALHEILTWGRQPGNNRTSAGGINGWLERNPPPPFSHIGTVDLRVLSSPYAL